jgi:hypothetical protein
MNISHLIAALTYIAGRKCECAKLGKEPPPCSHAKAIEALAEHEKVLRSIRVHRRLSSR